MKPDFAYPGFILLFEARIQYMIILFQNFYFIVIIKNMFFGNLCSDFAAAPVQATNEVKSWN
jgi:hypothetical protein